MLNTIGTMEALLDRIRRAPSILDVFSMADELVAAAAWSTRPDRDLDVLVQATTEGSDAPTAIAAVHALGRLAGTGPDRRLAELIGSATSWLVPHAAWVLGRRPPRADLVAPLAGLVAEGRLAGMLAQGTLARWAVDRPDLVTHALVSGLHDVQSPAARARLVETLALVRGADLLLAGIAADAAEATDARLAALAAYGDRADAPLRLLQAIASGDGPSADVARLALLDQELRSTPRARPDDGLLRLAQVHLGGRLDSTLTHAGEGDTGGIATLLVQLGDALARDPRVGALTTIGRGTVADGIASLEASGSQHAFMPVPLGGHEGASFADAWPARIAAERGLRRILRLRPATVLHLRMADVGTLAAARVARSEGLPTIFTLAPDPHAVIVEMEHAGELDRSSFGPADVRTNLWYRARLVARLARDARQVALLPRPALATRLRDLVGIDVTIDPDRYHVVPEGIDLAAIRLARARVGRAGEIGPSTAIAQLRDGLAALGPDRRGLPIVVSVGRLIEIKGMARIVEAFAADPELCRRANLVIVGGDFDHPSPAERAEIERMEAVLADRPDVARAVVLVGHRPHDDVLQILAAASSGLAPWIAPGGAYVCGSRKEEFGLAIVEALAAGLPVVAPIVGGPASYVDDGETGLLVDTLDSSALAAGIRGSLDLAGIPGRAERAERIVEERLTIEAMSRALVPIYAAASPVAISAGRPEVVATGRPTALIGATSGLATAIAAT